MTKNEALEIALDYVLRTTYWTEGRDRHDTLKAIKEALTQPQERYFCSRCGKRLSKDINDVHSCTPPRDIHGEPVNLPLRTFDDYGNKIK